MINKEKARLYCSEDISLIENYNDAIASPEKWVCHHRGEILPCGRYSRKTLMKFGLYWKRPASELIFLTAFEHKSMHTSGKQYALGYHHTEAAKEKMRQAHRGKKNALGYHHTYEAKENIRRAMLGNKNALGTHWYNNGVESVMARECPPGFVPGRIKWKKKSAA